MSQILHAALNVVRRKRTCSKCGKSHIVPSGKEKETVVCSSCGADIPPVKKE